MLDRCWTHNSASSLSRALPHVLRATRGLDALLFNTYVTAFGRRMSANLTGLLLPIIVSRLSRIPTFVYMHNFVETQDVAKLGYQARWIERRGAQLLEQGILRSTTVFVPLASQADTVRKVFGVSPLVEFIPHLEGSLTAESALITGLERPEVPRPGLRVILVGTWGPQKDLDGVLAKFDVAARQGLDIFVTVAGTSSRNFPDYLRPSATQGYESLRDRVRFMGELHEKELFSELRSSDLLVLPTNAAGGYSGTLNLATTAGIPVIAYDHRQHREQAAQLDGAITFVEPADLLGAVKATAGGPFDRDARDAGRIVGRLRKRDFAVAKLVERISTMVGTLKSRHVS